ncbi:MAG: hypothetical protein HY017_00325 [Betaproteobacteria bacterium]|nr:hypothetical protein [Betaproteobacteria bacterium]
MKGMPGMMKTSVAAFAVLATIAVLALPDEAWARRGGARSGHFHRNVLRPAFVGGALFYPWPYSYHFYPLPSGFREPGRVVYVEQFSGTLTPDTIDWIYCPSLTASYPEVTDCPGGWQRVIPQEQATHRDPAR